MVFLVHNLLSQVHSIAVDNYAGIPQEEAQEVLDNVSLVPVPKVLESVPALPVAPVAKGPVELRPLSSPHERYSVYSSNTPQFS